MQEPAAQCTLYTIRGESKTAACHGCVSTFYCRDLAKLPHTTNTISILYPVLWISNLN